MKYKIGDKARVKNNLQDDVFYGKVPYAKTMEKYKGEVLTIDSISKEYYFVKEDYGKYKWTDEMLEPVEEMSAEELAKTIGNICKVHNECKECPFHDVGDEDYCVIRRGKNADKTLKIAKQWKADHEKKPIETEFIYIVRIIEDKQCVHEEEIVGESEDEACERVLKKYCEDHEGKFYAVVERICRVKE